MSHVKDIRSQATHKTLLSKIESCISGNPKLIAAFQNTPREFFVPENAKSFAYLDRPVLIPCEQTTSQPTLIAMMIDALQLNGTERVLEIGTGFGYQTALLARVCKHVYSIDRHSELTEGALANLKKAGISNVTLFTGDGTLGLSEHAPFDAIIGSAAIAAIPKPVADQLSENGVLVHPIGPGGEEWVVVYRKQKGKLTETARLTRATFVRMIGVHGHDSP